MHIGITYDLKDDYLAQGFSKEACAEFDSIDTIDAIDTFLKSRGATTERIGNIQALTRAVANNKRWDCVFNIAEGVYGRGREAQVPALLDAYQIPYIFSDPLVLALTLDKALTKRVVRDAGVRTAEFKMIGGIEELKKQDSFAPQFPNSPPFPLFLKPNADGTGKGISARSLVRSEREFHETASDLLARFHQPVLAEQYMPGREFTVGITGTNNAASVIGVMEIILNETADSEGYTYENKQQYETRIEYKLVDDTEAREAADVALAAWRVLGCRDGGRIDIRSDAHAKPHFLEVNPLAGLHPVLGDLVILSKFADLSYHDLLGRILDSALADPLRFPQRNSPVITQYA